jgi:hypothetical protein
MLGVPMVDGETQAKVVMAEGSSSQRATLKQS